MGILSGNPKNEPMHYGEIFGVWEASMMAKGMVSCYQAPSLKRGRLFILHFAIRNLASIIPRLNGLRP